MLLRGSGANTNATGTDPRPEIARVVANGLTGNGIPQADRTYLASLVAAHTGISQGEAEQRVDALINHAKDTLDKIRKATSAAAFFMALSLMIGAFIACTTAALGGRWRDAPVPSTT